MPNTTFTAWTTIGRNVGPDPLDAGNWQAFHMAIRDSIHDTGGTILATIHGTSEWDGVAEDTVAVLAEWEITGWRNHWSYALHHYRYVLLPALVKFWGQEAIGFVGSTEPCYVVAR